MDQEQLAKQTYLNADEAADYLRFPSTEALRKWVRRHAVPHFRAGRNLLFLRRDLDEAVGNYSTRKGRQKP